MDETGTMALLANAPEKVPWEQVDRDGPLPADRGTKVRSGQGVPDGTMKPTLSRRAPAADRPHLRACLPVPARPHFASPFSLDRSLRSEGADDESGTDGDAGQPPR